MVGTTIFERKVQPMRPPVTVVCLALAFTSLATREVLAGARHGFVLAVAILIDAFEQQSAF